MPIWCKSGSKFGWSKCVSPQKSNPLKYRKMMGPGKGESFILLSILGPCDEEFRAVAYTSHIVKDKRLENCYFCPFVATLRTVRGVDFETTLRT